MTRDELFGRLLACVAAVEEGVCARRTRSGLVSLNARTAAPGAPLRAFYSARQMVWGAAQALGGGAQAAVQKAGARMKALWAAAPAAWQTDAPLEDPARFFAAFDEELTAWRKAGGA